MVKKHYYSWNDIEAMCSSITLQMYADNFRPDYIVGITRGGNVPATIISNMTGIPCEALKVSLRDDTKQSEHNTIMEHDSKLGKKILVVDDINDTGSTFKWIWNDWELTKDSNVKFATLTENLASEFGEVSYCVHEVNKAEEDVWLVYPWENVGQYA
tara:strand:- start:218 stop:688 length:471 start_codon:yes stop_codon:yes gene_type:complete